MTDVEGHWSYFCNFVLLASFRLAAWLTGSSCICDTEHGRWSCQRASHLQKMAQKSRPLLASESIKAQTGEESLRISVMLDVLQN